MDGGLINQISIKISVNKKHISPTTQPMVNQLINPGLTIHYHDFNKNGSPGVLLLHGLGATCESWQLQTPALVEAGYRVIAPDMRGFGQVHILAAETLLKLWQVTCYIFWSNYLLKKFTWLVFPLAVPLL